ncbi:MAG: hypothetical protein ABWK05_07045 [Pyrobaculum sp.]
MPRRKKAPPEGEGDVAEEYVSGPKLAVAIKAECPACKKLLSLKTVKYYIGKRILEVVDISVARWQLGEWAVNEHGLIYVLSTPTFFVYCNRYDNVLWKYRVQSLYEINDGLVTAVVGIYRSLAKTASCNV